MKPGKSLWRWEQCLSLFVRNNIKQKIRCSSRKNEMEVNCEENAKGVFLLELWLPKSLERSSPNKPHWVARSKAPRRSWSNDNLKYYKFNRLVGHHIQDYFFFKYKVVQLSREGEISLEEGNVATNQVNDRRSPLLKPHHIKWEVWAKKILNTICHGPRRETIVEHSKKNLAKDRWKKKNKKSKKKKKTRKKGKKKEVRDKASWRTSSNYPSQNPILKISS